MSLGSQRTPFPYGNCHDPFLVQPSEILSGSSYDFSNTNGSLSDTLLCPLPLSVYPANTVPTCSLSLEQLHGIPAAGASWCNVPFSVAGHLDKALRFPGSLLWDPRNPQGREEASSAVSRRSLSGNHKAGSGAKCKWTPPPTHTLPVTSWLEKLQLKRYRGAVGGGGGGPHLRCRGLLICLRPGALH